eukprot:15433717-Alexandrium_andersonii.AAC.1
MCVGPVSTSPGNPSVLVAVASFKDPAWDTELYVPFYIRGDEMTPVASCDCPVPFWQVQVVETPTANLESAAKDVHITVPSKLGLERESIVASVTSLSPCEKAVGAREVLLSRGVLKYEVRAKKTRGSSLDLPTDISNFLGAIGAAKHVQENKKEMEGDAQVVAVDKAEMKRRKDRHAFAQTPLEP